MSDILFKFGQIILFGVISLIYVPAFIIVYFGTEFYQGWMDRVMKL
jgi:hypothetical protein